MLECTKGNGRCSIQGQSRISHACNGGHEGRYCICIKCGECGEPIHVEGQSTSLDSCETYHEVEGHCGVQIMPQRQARILTWADFAMRIGREMLTTGDSLQGTYILLALEAFHGNARNNQPLYYLQQRQSTWPLAIARKKRFGLGNFWRMWDTCKKGRDPSCAIIKDA